MRSLSTSAALSSIFLGGWLAAAGAQNVIPNASNALSPDLDGQAADSGNPQVGVIPQPTVASPGVVMGITLGELYTDNIKLAAADQPKQTSWITQIQPFIRSAWSGPQFSGVLDYDLTGYLYAGQSRYDQVAQDLKAQGTVTIFPQHLFLGASALYGRKAISNELPSGAGTFFLNNNQANVAKAMLSPYWIQDLGRLGTVTLRYTLARVLYNDRGISGQNADPLSGIPDVTSKALQFSLASPEFETWGWNLGYSDQRIERDLGQDIDYAVAKLGTSWQINSSTQLLADAGKENRFLPNGTSKKLGASFWDTGFDWSNTRNDLNFLVGHRFYGHSYQLSWTHTAALLNTAVSYVEQPTDLNQQLLGQNPGEIISSFGGSSVIPSLMERQVYLMKRATGSATYILPRGKLGVTLYDEQRTFFNLSNSQERVANANIDWLFNIGPFTTLTPTLGWQRYQFQDGQVQHDTYEQLAFVHQFNPQNFGSVRLRHDSRDVDSGVLLPGSLGYGVNILFVQWTHLF